MKNKCPYEEDEKLYVLMKKYSKMKESGRTNRKSYLEYHQPQIDCWQPKFHMPGHHLVEWSNQCCLPPHALSVLPCIVKALQQQHQEEPQHYSYAFPILSLCLSKQCQNVVVCLDTIILNVLFVWFWWQCNVVCRLYIDYSNAKLMWKSSSLS